MLNVIFGLLDAYTWLIEAPLAVYRLVRRIRHPTAEEKAAAGTPEMKRFWRNVWLAVAVGLGLCIYVGIAAESPWFCILAVVLALIIVPGLVEKRFDKLVAALRPPALPSR
ncbi:MAG TPA: hypothetical protein VEC60_02275 [Reyranella sp.]|nr:hypothetical protein [Reyranella sp.]